MHSMKKWNMDTSKTFVVPSFQHCIKNLSTLTVTQDHSYVFPFQKPEMNISASNMQTLDCVTSYEPIDIHAIGKYEAACNSVQALSRKRRLDHLTVEEKLQRKKMKNRVAAQSSRDRKKARMDQLENEVKELSDRCKRLEEENAQLRQQLMKSESSVSPSFSTAGPAVSNASAPQPQGQKLKLAPILDQHLCCQILMLFLLSQISLKTWKVMTLPHNWKNWQTVSLKRLLRKWLERMKENMNGRAIKSSPVVKWWGRHQKNWNPLNSPIFVAASCT